MNLIIGNFVSHVLRSIRQAGTEERVYTLLACAAAHGAATTQTEKNWIAQAANRKLRDLERQTMTRFSIQIIHTEAASVKETGAAKKEFRRKLGESKKTQSFTA